MGKQSVEQKRARAEKERLLREKEREEERRASIARAEKERLQREEEAKVRKSLQKALGAYVSQPSASKIWRVDNFHVSAASGVHGETCRLSVVASTEVSLVLYYGFA